MTNRGLALGVTLAGALVVTGLSNRPPAARPVITPHVEREPVPQPAPQVPGERGEDLLHRFFGTHWARGSAVAPDTFELGILIATLPDPYDSHLDWSFDAELEAMRRAFETVGYVTDRFWLPGPKDSIGPKDGDRRPLREVQPGVMLFRHADSTTHLLQLLYLVPELPTRGIYKDVMRAALEERHELLRHHDLPLRSDTTGPVRIVGPTFSGSALSLQFALRGWRASHPRDSIRIISGTATSMANLGVLDCRDLGLSFRATINPDERLDRLLTDTIVPSLGLAPSEVAVLQESSTQYGQALLGSGTGPGAFVVIPFPMSISSLRSEYQRNPAVDQGEQTLPGSSAPRLPLDLLDATRPREDLPLTSRLSPLALDLMLDDLARTLTRRRIRLVGLLATDVRDKLFLAEEIRRRVRDVRFFTYESNILYLRPDRNDALRGMLVLSTYPLIIDQWGRSQVADGRWFAFSSDAAEGVFNATLLQLGSTERLLDYRSTVRQDSGLSLIPFPPVWVTTVGAGTFLPVLVSPSDAISRQYLAPGRGVRRPATSRCEAPAGPAAVEIASDTSIAGLATAMSGYDPSRSSRNGIPLLPLAAMMLSSFGLIGLAGGSLVTDRRIRSHLTGLLGVAGVDPRPIAEQVVDGSLRLHERLYGLLRLVAVAGIFIAACGSGLRLVSSHWNATLWALLLLALVTASALVLALGSGLGSVAALLRRYGPVGWEYFLHGPFRTARERWEWRVEVIARGVVACFGLAYLGLSIGFIVESGSAGRAASWLFLRRASEIDSLVSPILPLILAGAGYAIWSTWHLQRIALLRGHTTFESALENELTGEPATRVTIGSALRDDLRRSARAAYQIRDRLFRVIPGHGALLVLAAFLCLAAWLLPQFGRSLEAIALGAEALPYFDWLFRVMLLVAFLATAWGATRMVVVWQGLRQCLEGFARTPIVIAFERLPPRLARLTGLTVPRDDATPLGIVADVQWLHLQRIYAARSEAFESALGTANPRLVRQVAELMQIPAAQASRLDTLGRTALMARFTALHDILRELWRLEPMPDDVRVMIASLEKEFEKADSAMGPDASTTLRLRRGFAGPVRLWLRAAEEYAVTVMVEYVEWVIKHLRVLALFMLLSLLLTTLLVSSYPYPPQSLLRLVLLVVMVGTVGALVAVLVQMNRNEVLSRIARTEPGKVTWNLDFVLNLLTFGGVPLLTLMSAEFPELRQLLFAWADPLLRALVRQ